MIPTNDYTDSFTYSTRVNGEMGRGFMAVNDDLFCNETKKTKNNNNNDMNDHLEVKYYLCTNGFCSAGSNGGGGSK